MWNKSTVCSMCQTVLKSTLTHPLFLVLLETICWLFQGENFEEDLLSLSEFTFRFCVSTPSLQTPSVWYVVQICHVQPYIISC